MPNLKPFRDYDEHDVLNLFAYSGSNTVNKGTFVRIQSGFLNTDLLGYGPMNGLAVANTVSLRWGPKAKVTQTTSGEFPIGMMLYDVRETDENGNLLVYNAQKAAEMQAVISGQAVPIVTRGTFLYSGVDGSPTAYAPLYPSTGGTLTTTQVSGPITGTAVARALGPKDVDGWVLIKVLCT